MIPEIYVYDDSAVTDEALLTMWRGVCATRRYVAIGLRPERLDRVSIETWEAGRALVCVVGSSDRALSEEADGVHLLDASPSRVRAARRVVGPERLLLAPGPPRTDDVWDDADGVDAWLVSVEATDGSVPAIVWVRDADEARRAGAAARGYAIRVSRLRNTDARWITDFCESVFNG